MFKFDSVDDQHMFESALMLLVVVPNLKIKEVDLFAAPSNTGPLKSVNERKWIHRMRPTCVKWVFIIFIYIFLERCTFL